MTRGSDDVAERSLQEQLIQLEKARVAQRRTIEAEEIARGLAASIEQVRALHREYEGRCVTCVECEWPCPTTRALNAPPANTNPATGTPA